MIVSLPESTETTKNAQVYLEKSTGLSSVILQSIKNNNLSAAQEKLFILDLDAKDRFWRDIKPGAFANTLLNNGLPKTVRTLYFITSDVNKTHNLREFSRELIQVLQNENYQLSAYVPTDFNNDLTLLVAPGIKNNNSWQVFGINDRPKNVNFSSLCKIKQKKLLWEGEDILEWLEKNEKKVTAAPAVPETVSFRL